MPKSEGETNDYKFQEISRNPVQKVHNKQNSPQQSETNRKNACAKPRNGKVKGSRAMERRLQMPQSIGGNSSSNTATIPKKSEKEKNLTQARVRELFIYSSISGKLVRKIDVKSNARAGDIIESVVNKDGYVYVGIDGYRYAVHRVIWLYTYGEFPNGDIDHINHNRTDNRVENLRVVTNRENHQNRSKKTLSGHTGVTWDEVKRRWRAQVSIIGKTRCIGIYKTVEEAICARKAVNKIIDIALKNGVSL